MSYINYFFLEHKYFAYISSIISGSSLIYLKYAQKITYQKLICLLFSYLHKSLLISLS